MTTNQSDTRRRNGLRALIVGALTALTLLIPTAASAANGGDPAAGCDSQNASRHNPVSMFDPNGGAKMGTAYLVYSSGCKTEWTLVEYTSGYDPRPSIWMKNQSGTDLYMTNSGTSTKRWTYQLSNMQYQVGCGGVQMYRSNGTYVDWFYLGCY